MTPRGLCENCIHAQRVVNGRGSEFLLCQRSKSDPRYARYPALPVTFCPGLEVGAPTEESDR